MRRANDLIEQCGIQRKILLDSLLDVDVVDVDIDVDVDGQG